MKRILVVDDNEVNRSLLQILLGRDGLEVELARDGQEALERAASQLPDLVISDLLMPVMDGYTLLRHWKTDDRLRAIPFVIYTGTYTDLQDEKLANDLGADAYLRKPMEPEELTARVREILARTTSCATPVRAPVADAGQQMVGYSRALVRKLEDKTERLECVNRELEDANDRLRQLSQRLLEVQEEERATIARELHDEIGQALTAIKLGAQSLATRAQGGDARRLAECIAAADGALGQVRSLALELRPPQLDHLGLAGALRELTERMADSTQIEAQFVMDGRDIAAPADLAITAYRLVQEALTNVVRHSGAKHVTVELACRGDELRIAVADDGRGFDVEAARSRGLRGRSLGLIGMQERAALAGGWLRLESQPGRGTRLEAGFGPRARGCAA